MTAVGLRVLSLVDRSRLVHVGPGRAEPRRLVTIVRYPAEGPAGARDVPGAPPARTGRPFPLVIFGHGFAERPTAYARLLQAWTRAGYVVAAPIFPLENPDAPGGPDEDDLGNQPRDMSFVISSLLAAGAGKSGFLAGLVDPGRVAVTGHSDGGETALGVAYDRLYLDRRVAAVIILAGARIPHGGGLEFRRPSPPLLASEGTADTINPPSFTNAFFALVPAPKYLLTLYGAPHLSPYTDGQPQLGVVERVTTAFLDLYLKRRPGARRLLAGGQVAGIAALSASP